MVLGSFFFKHRARQILKGYWQTALLVTFFTSLLLTVAQVAQSVVMKDINALMSSLSAVLNTMPREVTVGSTQYYEMTDLYRRLFEAVSAVPQSTWTLLLGINLLALVVTPALNVSCNRYFIGRVDGEEMSAFEGLTSRLSIFLRSLWLHVIMGVKIFLWSLLLVIPGIVAALRYSMAPYYLAEDPSLTAGQAMRKSKETMKDKKMSYFMLQLSFVVWSLFISLVQLFLSGVSPVVALVAAQFMSLAVSAYLNASCAVFYTAVSRPNGLGDLVRSARTHLQQMGVDESAFPPEEELLDNDSEDGSDEL